MATSSPPPLPYVARFGHPVYYARATLIKANSLSDAQALAAAGIKGTLWTVISVVPYTAPYG